MSETNKKRMKRIFLIEDDAKFAKSFCRLLIDEGYEVTANSNAGIAVGWATDKEIGFDMIISDQQMPGEVGSSFLAFLATLEKTDPEKLDKSSKMYQDVRGRFSKLNDAEFKDVLKNMKVHPHKRVILSGYAENDDIRKALEAGIIHKFISKKMPMKQILETIRTLLQ